MRLHRSLSFNVRRVHLTLLHERRLDIDDGRQSLRCPENTPDVAQLDLRPFERHVAVNELVPAMVQSVAHQPHDNSAELALPARTACVIWQAPGRDFISWTKKYRLVTSRFFSALTARPTYNQIELAKPRLTNHAPTARQPAGQTEGGHLPKFSRSDGTTLPFFCSCCFCDSCGAVRYAPEDLPLHGRDPASLQAESPHYGIRRTARFLANERPSSAEARISPAASLIVNRSGSQGSSVQWNRPKIGECRN